MTFSLDVVAVASCAATAVALDAIRHLGSLREWTHMLRTPGPDRTLRFGLYAVGTAALFSGFYFFARPQGESEDMLKLVFAAGVAFCALPQMTADIQKMRHQHRLSRLRVIRPTK